MTALRRACGCLYDPGVFGHDWREHGHFEWLTAYRRELYRLSGRPAAEQLAELRRADQAVREARGDVGLLLPEDHSPPVLEHVGHPPWWWPLTRARGRSG